MPKPLEIDVVTIFPGMLNGFLEESMLKRAEKMGRVRFRTINLRDFTDDAHRTTDDRPYGGGPGMVMKPEPIFRAVESVRRECTRVIMMTPQGTQFRQPMAEALAEKEHLLFLSGHYEGIDERVREHVVTDEISIGDYVLTNGTLAAAVVIDAIVRLLPDVLGGEGALERESFRDNLLDYPQYTRPATFRGLDVPEVLRSGDHAAIRRWREAEARKRTEARRPDLLAD